MLQETDLEIVKEKRLLLAPHFSCSDVCLPAFVEVFLYQLKKDHLWACATVGENDHTVPTRLFTATSPLSLDRKDNLKKRGDLYRTPMIHMYLPSQRSAKSLPIISSVSPKLLSAFFWFFYVLASRFILHVDQTRLFPQTLYPSSGKSKHAG